MQLWNEAPSEARGLPPFGPPSLSIRPSAEPKLAIQIFLLVVGGGSLVGVFIATLSIFFDRRLVAKGAA